MKLAVSNKSALPLRGPAPRRKSPPLPTISERGAVDHGAVYRETPSAAVRDRASSNRREAGMTLIEVVVALGLLAVLASSVISITFQIRSRAEQAIYQNTALTLAEGYMEQIRHLDYTTLKLVAQDSASAVTLPLNNASGGAITPLSGSFFGNGIWSTETIYLDQNAQGQPTQPVTFRFRPVLTSLETATSNVASGVEIVIFYQTTYNFGITRTFDSSLRSVRSSVPTY